MGSGWNRLYLEAEGKLLRAAQSCKQLETQGDVTG